MQFKEFKKLYDTDISKAESYVKNAYQIRDLADAGLSFNEFQKLNKQETEFYLKNSGAIATLATLELPFKEFKELHVNNPQKANFYLENFINIEALNKSGINIDQISQKYDTDPKAAELLVKNTNLLKNNNVTAKSLIASSAEEIQKLTSEIKQNKIPNNWANKFLPKETNKGSWVTKTQNKTQNKSPII